MWSVAALRQVESPVLLLLFSGNKEFNKWQNFGLGFKQDFSSFFLKFSQETQGATVGAAKGRNQNFPVVRRLQWSLNVIKFTAKIEGNHRISCDCNIIWTL